MKLGHNRIRSVTLMAVVAVLAITACGGGVSDEALAFCNDYAGVNTLIATGPDEENPEAWVNEVVSGLESLRTAAPSELDPAVGRIADSLLGPLQSLDEEGFNDATGSQTFIDDSASVSDYLVNECDFGSVDVTAVDYAYDADLESVASGPTAFRFSNDGSEVHEMVMVRINDDTTETIEELLDLPEEEAFAKVTDAGFAFQFPGGSTTFYADLEPGRYAFFCFLPVGATPDNMEALESGQVDGPPHFTQGMIREFTVES